MNKNELIELSRNGDDAAFEELVVLLESRVAATIFGILGNCPEVDDVGQQTFIKLYKSLPSFRGDAGIETYVTRIAINLSLNELKRRKRRSQLFISKSPKEFENIPNIISDAEEREIHDAIRWAIQQLDPKFRTVVVLRLINGYSVKETAGILKLPQGTILSRLARAQKKLRKLLKPLFFDN